MKTFHEAPIYYMDLVDRLTDGTYFLVHLFEDNEDYLERAMSVSRDRHVILDNSVFELETEFDSNRFAHWIDLTRPTEYIIPDKLEDRDKTIQNVIDWNNEFKSNVPGKSIGVIQGKSYQEIVDCYKAIEPLVDKVAISFDYSCYKQIAYAWGGIDKLELWMHGRRALLSRLLQDGIINTNKPHHLLGGSLVNEWRSYIGYSWIESVDTSSPIMWAMEKKLYTGEVYKPAAKLFTLIDFEPSSIDEDLDITNKMVQNIATFRKTCNG